MNHQHLWDATDSMLQSIIKTIKANNVQMLFIDLFAGAGGVSQGIFESELKNAKCALTYYAVNHDETAILSHAENHPYAFHADEDITTFNLDHLIHVTEKLRALFPHVKICLWASLECTNFSKAKGGKPRDADSRTLAEHLYRYIVALNPDMVWIENVVEFLAWGPLDDNGKPINKRQGIDFIKWKQQVESYGYKSEYKELNAADYGAHTSRIRLFMQFAKPKIKIAWPPPSHQKASNNAKKKPIEVQLFEQTHLKKWKAVREVLELDSKGESIFNRKRPLVEATLSRVYEGLIKFVAGGKEAHAEHMSKYTSNECKTITMQQSANFISSYYGSGDNNKSVELPAPTLRTHDGAALVQPQWIDRDFSSGGGRINSINQPAGSITTIPKMNLVTTDSFIVNPHWFNTGLSSVDAPAPTLIARMDKTPPYIVFTESGEMAIEVYDTDSHFTKLIKQFMAAYGICDVYMRMLYVSELKRIQGFGTEYKLLGTQTNQKKFIGNSVPPKVVRAMIEHSCQINLTLAA